MGVVWHDAAAQEPEGFIPAATTPSDVAAADRQPIAFSHSRHVEQAAIDCQFCHAYARRGPVAGIPSVERCAGCHRSILTERPEIVKVLDYWEREMPIPWVRVHDLPDYVRFSHKAHVRSGIDCAACHGDVARMDIAVPGGVAVDGVVRRLPQFPRSVPRLPGVPLLERRNQRLGSHGA